MCVTSTKRPGTRMESLARVRPVLFGHRHHAFSLLELVVVIAVVAALAAIVAPRFDGVLARNRADAAAYRVANDLALARAEARASGAPRHVEIKSMKTEYVLVGVSNPLTRIGTSYSVELADSPYVAQIVRVDFAGEDDITFNAFGDPHSAGCIILRSGREWRRISVDEAGRATVERITRDQTIPLGINPDVIESTRVVPLKLNLPTLLEDLR